MVPVIPFDGSAPDGQLRSKRVATDRDYRTSQR